MLTEANVAELIGTFAFWRGYRRRNQFEDEVAAMIADGPEACFAGALPEMRNSVATRRAAAAVILGRLVEDTQERFATEIERELMTALAVERSIKAAEELALALGRAWSALGTSADLVEMARDSRAAYRLTAAHDLAFVAESPEELAALERLATDEVPRIRWWAEFGLAPPDA